MRKTIFVLLLSLFFLLTACGGNAEKGEEAGKSETKEGKSTQEKYVLATDDDFISYSDFLKRYEYEDHYKELTRISEDAEWYYVGEAEYVEIPDEIQGSEVIKYGGMFAHNTTVKGVKSSNTAVRAASGMFQYMEGDVLDLTELDVSSLVVADQMFQGAKLETINFGEKEFSNLTESKALFKLAEINDLDLSTLTFPELTIFEETFMDYKGGQLNVNIPELPKLESIEYFFEYTAEVENLEINDIDLDNVSDLVIVFGGLTLGGDSTLDLSNWTLPNVEREVVGIGLSDDVYVEHEKVPGLFSASAEHRYIEVLDLSSLHGSVMSRHFLTDDGFKKVTVKGENEYQSYLIDEMYLEKDFEKGPPEPYTNASEERWKEAVEAFERKKKNFENFELEVVEH